MILGKRPQAIPACDLLLSGLHYVLMVELLEEVELLEAMELPEAMELLEVTELLAVPGSFSVLIRKYHFLPFIFIGFPITATLSVLLIFLKYFLNFGKYAVGFSFFMGSSQKPTTVIFFLSGIEKLISAFLL